MNLFNASPHSKIDLPEPIGEKKIVQEKVFIPVQQHPEVSFDQMTVMVQLLLIHALCQQFSIV